MILILLRVKLDRWINIPNTFYFIDHYGVTGTSVQKIAVEKRTTDDKLR